jgi:hypothetical protein
MKVKIPRKSYLKTALNYQNNRHFYKIAVLIFLSKDQMAFGMMERPAVASKDDHHSRCSIYSHLSRFPTIPGWNVETQTQIQKENRQLYIAITH